MHFPAVCSDSFGYSPINLRRRKRLGDAFNCIQLCNQRDESFSWSQWYSVYVVGHCFLLVQLKAHQPDLLSNVSFYGAFTPFPGSSVLLHQLGQPRHQYASWFLLWVLDSTDGAKVCWTRHILQVMLLALCSGLLYSISVCSLLLELPTSLQIHCFLSSVIYCHGGFISLVACPDQWGMRVFFPCPLTAIILF